MRYIILHLCLALSILASPLSNTDRQRFDMSRYTNGLLPARIPAQSIQTYLRSPLKPDHATPATFVTDEDSLDEGQGEMWIEDGEEEEEEGEEEKKAWKLATELAILKRVWSSRDRRDRFVDAAKAVLAKSGKGGKNYVELASGRLNWAREEANRFANDLRGMSAVPRDVERELMRFVGRRISLSTTNVAITYVLASIPCSHLRIPVNVAVLSYSIP